MVRPAARSAFTKGRKRVAVGFLQFHRRLVADRILQRSAQQDICFGKRAVIGKLFGHVLQQINEIPARNGDRHPRFGHLGFDRLEPVFVAAILTEQPVAAAHGFLEVHRPSAMRRINGQDHSVEKRLRSLAGPVTRRSSMPIANVRDCPEFRISASTSPLPFSAWARSFRASGNAPSTAMPPTRNWA